MKNRLFSIAALGAAVLMSGCVAYPVDGYHDGQRGYYGERNDRDYRGGRDCRDERNCDRRDRDGDRRDDRYPRP